MLEKSFGLLYFLKQAGNEPKKYIYLRITVDGHPAELSTKKQWWENRWDQDKAAQAVLNRTKLFDGLPGKNIFKCFGCGREGGPIEFIMAFKSTSRQEAMGFLLNEMGLVM